MDAAARDNRPRIKRILKSYQEAAITMNGPSRTVGNDLPSNTYISVGKSFDESANASTLSVKMAQGNRNAEKRGYCDYSDSNSLKAKYRRADAYLIQIRSCFDPQRHDNEHGEKSETEIIWTTLEGKYIPGFEVGGEPRLCLPSIITSVLPAFTAEQILTVCTDLNFFLATCTNAHLEALKCADVLPMNTTQCGLIRRTDAERMCNVLLHATDKQLSQEGRKLICREGQFVESCQKQLDVFHECFGGCCGRFMIDEYTSPDAECIYCRECGVAYNPEQFVGHCHTDPERHACHWGFDPKRWRSYLMIAWSNVENEKREQLDVVLSDLMRKFTPFSDCDSVDDCDGNESILVSHAAVSARGEKRSGAGVGDAGAALASPTISISQSLQGFLDSLQQQLTGASLSVERNNNLRITHEAPVVTLPAHLHRGEPILLHNREPSCHYTDIQQRDGASSAPNVSLDPKPYMQLREQYPPEEYDEKESFVESEEQCTTAKVLYRRRTISSTYSPVSSKTAACDDGSVETESVMSDKLTLENVGEEEKTEEEDEEEDVDNHMTSEKLTVDIDRKMDLLRAALGEEAELSAEVKRARVEEFITIQNSHRELVHSLQDSHHCLEKEYSRVWNEIAEKQSCMTEQQKSHEECVARMKQENATKMREATLARYKLMQNIDSFASGVDNSELATMAAQYRAEADGLKHELERVQGANSKLRKEVEELRMTVKQQKATATNVVLPVMKNLVVAVQPGTVATGWFTPDTVIFSLNR